MIAGPTEYYTGPTKKQRNRTLVDEVLNNSEMRQHVKEKFKKLLASKRGYNKVKFIKSTGLKFNKKTTKKSTK